MNDDLKKKDNLTDVVEQLPKADISEIPKTSDSDPKPKDEQQVVNSEGEVITLNQKENKK